VLHRITAAAGGALQRGASSREYSFALGANIERKVRRPTVCVVHHNVQPKRTLRTKPRDDLTNELLVPGNESRLSGEFHLLQIPGHVYMPSQFLLHKIPQLAGSVGLAVNQVGHLGPVAESA